jgi:hypothetical protein
VGDRVLGFSLEHDRVPFSVGKAAMELHQFLDDFQLCTNNKCLPHAEDGVHRSQKERSEIERSRVVIDERRGGEFDDFNVLGDEG